MYKLRFSDYFDKKYQKLVKNNPQIIQRVDKTLRILQENPKHPGLKSHLVNHEDLGKVWSSSVTRDIRIIWMYDQDNVMILLILNIGGHSGSNSVYR